MTPAARTRQWMFDHALPLWAEEGVDHEHGGFAERLTPDGRFDPIDLKRLRGQARQIYAFSHAATLGFEPGAALALQGLEFVERHAALAGGGWARALGRDGRVLDTALDLYDQACMLLALAWLKQATGETAAIRLAERGFEAVKHRLGRAEGYRALEAGGNLGLQNPHMHWLEAMLALHAATGDKLWADEARAMLRLFRERLFDPVTGALAERFDAAWARDPTAALEPGHHFEWVWLLTTADRLLGTDHFGQIRGLFVFAAERGLSPATGLVWDEIGADGAVRSASHRLWPQSERLKAYVAVGERAGNLDQPAIGRVVDGLFDRFLDPAPSGGWRDRLDVHGDAHDAFMPASSLYHLFSGFSELWRVTGEVG
ncbi:MAG: AGE family epimerase/isomerase [Proteobacteria bacterium]|nr:AGE family epimerase/isomerase [Pseudomonadota bacterium]